MFFKLYKWHQILQSITNILVLVTSVEACQNRRYCIIFSLESENRKKNFCAVSSAFLAYFQSKFHILRIAFKFAV